MTSPSKVKGSAWERAVVSRLRYWGIRAERRFGAGATDDKGDIVGLPGFCIEAKNEKTINLAGYMDETERERVNAGCAYGVAVVKRRGKDAGQGYVVMTLDSFARLMSEGGDAMGTPGSDA